MCGTQVRHAVQLGSNLNLNMNAQELLRWALADQAFAEADSLAMHVIEVNPEQGSPLFSACCTGIASCYCRPFMSSNGLGSLPDEIKALKKFDGLPQERRLQKVHEMLLDTRVHFGGHFDPVYAEQMHQKGELESSLCEVKLSLGPEGVNTTVNLVHMDIRAVAFARKLFSVQRARVNDVLGSFGEQLRKQNQGKLGDYYFHASTPSRKRESQA